MVISDFRYSDVGLVQVREVEIHNSVAAAEEVVVDDLVEVGILLDLLGCRVLVVAELQDLTALCHYPEDWLISEVSMAVDRSLGQQC